MNLTLIKLIDYVFTVARYNVIFSLNFSVIAALQMIRSNFFYFYGPYNNY